MSRLAKMAALVAAAAVAVACGGNGPKGPPPVISGLTPATGTVGTLVAIQGTGFAQGNSAAGAVNPVVTFTPSGGAAVQAIVQSFSATTLQVAVPPMAAGLSAPGSGFDVTVTNPGGAAVTLPHAFAMALPSLTDVNGGISGSGTVNSLFVLDGHNFGDLAAAPAGGGYSVDFRDASTGAVVASAAVNFANSDWQDIVILGTVPATLAASTTYKLTVTTPSGTSAPLGFLVVAAVSFSPSTIQWTATSSLPAGQQGFPTLITPIGANTLLYALGGNTASSTTASGAAANLDSVSFNQLVASSGALANASWTATTPLPARRGFAAAVAANAFNSLAGGNGVLYLLGGLDAAGAATSTVYFASPAADGTIPAAGAPGTWSTTTALPQPLFAAGAVIFHGRIYVAGGNDSTGTPVAKVYSSKVNADGTLDAWQTLADLPAALAYHQVVAAGDSLYVLGGTTAAVDPVTNAQSSSTQGAIYFQPINIRNGALANASWTTNGTAMGKTREKFTAVVAGSYLLVSGGLYSGASTGSSEQSYAAINPDGTIGSFNGATGSHTISGTASGYNFFNHSSAFFVDSGGNPHVLLLGGENTNTGAVESGVWVQN